MRVVVAALIGLTLSGCVTGEALVQETSRSLARTAVNGAVQSYLPGVNAAPYTDCVINNSTTGELIEFASLAAEGTQGATKAWPVVQKVASRGETQNCLVKAASNTPLSQVLGGLL